MGFPEASDLKMSLRRSLAWTYSAQALSFFVTFASTIIVARLVSPRDFGIFAMANAVTSVMTVVVSFGLAKYLIREAEVCQNLLRLLFTVNVITSILFVVLITTGALAAEYVFSSVEVAQFLFVFAVFPLIAMMEFIPSALCLREMRFGVIAAINVVRAGVLAATTVVLAFKGYAYMSFAWAQILAWIVTVVCYNVVVWRPDVWRPRFKGMQSVLRFGAQMVGVGAFGQLTTRGGEIALGSMLGLTTLGLYTRASGLPTSLYSIIFGAGSTVIYSRLSQDLREKGEIHETYLHFMRLLLGCLWPMLFGLAVVAPPLIHTLYGANWQASAIPLAFVAVSYAVIIGSGMTSEVFILRRETHVQVKIEGIRAVGGFLFFAGGAMISLPAAAAGKLIESIFAFFLYRKPMARFIDGPAGVLRRVYLEGIMVSVSAILPSFILMCWTRWSPLTPPIAVVSSIVIGGVMWAAILFKRQHPIATEVTRLLKQM